MTHKKDTALSVTAVAQMAHFGTNLSVLYGGISFEILNFCVLAQNGWRKLAQMLCRLNVVYEKENKMY
ncbi:hypothetical protein LQZ18_05260 [Lachnospiraceae bacterium ZAX-1]